MERFGQGGHGISHGDGPPATVGYPQNVIQALSTRPCDPDWGSELPGPLALNYPKGMWDQAQTIPKKIRFCIELTPGFAGVLPRDVVSACLAILTYGCREIFGPIPPSIAVESCDDYQC